MDNNEDDWLNDETVPHQGGEADPLTGREYDRIASKYYDVSFCPRTIN